MAESILTPAGENLEQNILVVAQPNLSADGALRRDWTCRFQCAQKRYGARWGCQAQKLDQSAACFMAPVVECDLPSFSNGTFKTECGNVLKFGLRRLLEKKKQKHIPLNDIFLQ